MLKVTIVSGSWCEARASKTQNTLRWSFSSGPAQYLKMLNFGTPHTFEACCWRCPIWESAINESEFLHTFVDTTLLWCAIRQGFVRTPSFMPFTHVPLYKQPVCCQVHVAKLTWFYDVSTNTWISNIQCCSQNTRVTYIGSAFLHFTRSVQLFQLAFVCNLGYSTPKIL